MRLGFFALLFSVVVSSHGWAMSFGSDDAPDMKSIKEVVDKKDFAKAIEDLQVFLKEDKNQNNADAWNLLGFSHRNSGNFGEAATAYDKALEIDPNHLDAIEYQGELFLMMQDMDKAKENAMKLKALCPDGCAQLTHFEDVMANGNY